MTKPEVGKKYLLKVSSHYDELQELNGTIVTVTGVHAEGQAYIDECNIKVYWDELTYLSKLELALK